MRKMRMLVETFAQMVHFMSKQSQISKTQAKMLPSLSSYPQQQEVVAGMETTCR